MSGSARGPARAFVPLALACVVGAACSAKELRGLAQSGRGTPALAGPFASAPTAPPPRAARVLPPTPEAAAALQAALPVEEQEPPPAAVALQEADTGSDQPETEPATESGPPGLAEEPEYVGPTLTSIARETLIYARPSFKSPKLKYLQVSAMINHSKLTMGNENCKRD